MKKLFIMKAGSTFSSTHASFGDFEDWIREGLGTVPFPVEVIDVRNMGVLPSPADCLGVIVTGSHAMVTDNLPWSIALERWIPGLVEAAVPFLGICYGHQLLGRATGGEVGYHPLGRELGTVEIRLEHAGIDEPLFLNIPGTFMAHSAHSQSVLRLPPGAVLLASGHYEPYHSFRIGKAAWGVQFHPEYSADIMRADICEGEKDRTAVHHGVPALSETPFAARVLANFADYVSSDRDE